jgi:hypothetical protein
MAEQITTFEVELVRTIGEKIERHIAVVPAKYACFGQRIKIRGEYWHVENVFMVGTSSIHKTPPVVYDHSDFQH